MATDGEFHTRYVGMTIRPATVADVPRLVEMGVAFLRASPYHDVLTENPAQMAAMATHLITAGEATTVLVAERQSVVVGMIGMMSSPHFLSGEMFAGEVFWWVDPVARGAGLRLLHAAETWARERGAAWMQMTAPDARVEKLYVRRGYRPLQRTCFRRFVA